MTEIIALTKPSREQFSCATEKRYGLNEVIFACVVTFKIFQTVQRKLYLPRPELNFPIQQW